MRIFILFTLAVAIISCSNSTGTEPEPNLVQIGTWSINTDEMTGTWTGSQAKSKTLATLQAEGDTLFFDAPNENGLRIWDTSEYDGQTKLHLEYIDSTLSATNLIVVYTPFTEFWRNHSLVSTNEHRMLANTSIPFSCDSTYNFEPGKEYIEMHMVDDNDDFLRALHFNTQGIIESGRYIVCGDSIAS